MRIVLLTHSLFFGGAERQLVLLAKGLQQRGHTVVVVPFYSGGPLEHELVDAGIPIRSLHKKGRWDIWAIVRRLPQVIQQEVPHVVHSYHGTPNLMSLVLKLFRLPPKVVWGIRSSNMDLVHYDDWVVAPLGPIIAWLSRFADAHIANSQTGLSHHVAIGYPAEKMVHIPNGVDTTRFRPDQAARVLVREEWGVSTEDRLIGLVARLDPIKGHPVFLEAASRLAHRDSSIKFVCVGDGPATYRAELQRHAQKLGLEDRLRWAGDRADMPAVQNALDLAVNSSLSEGLSNAISEAMACGVPCVVSDVGDSAWVVGSTGAIVPPNDPEALADAMGRMVTAREPDPSAIRRRILDHLSVDALVITTERTLLALCHQPTGKPVTPREKTPVC